MPFTEIVLSPAPGHIKKVCILCGCMDIITLDLLTLGIPGDSKNGIKMPSCSNCGANEVLIRTWDKLNGNLATSPSNLPRKALNGMAKLLKERGQVTEEFAEEVAAETEDPTHILPLPQVNIPLPQEAKQKYKEFYKR
jgi:hypothetical protein